MWTSKQSRMNRYQPHSLVLAVVVNRENHVYLMSFSRSTLLIDNQEKMNDKTWASAFLKQPLEYGDGAWLLQAWKLSYMFSHIGHWKDLSTIKAPRDQEQSHTWITKLTNFSFLDFSQNSYFQRQLDNNQGSGT